VIGRSIFTVTEDIALGYRVVFSRPRAFSEQNGRRIADSARSAEGHCGLLKMRTKPHIYLITPSAVSALYV